MASIAFFTNAGISAFNTAQSTNEQVLIEQIRIASESTADETTTVLTALYECNIQDITKSVDGMSFTIKSIIAKNTFTSTEITPVRVIGYYGRISNGGAKTLLAIALVDPIVNSDGTKSFVINSTFSLTPTAATTIRLTVSPYLSYVTVNDLASYTTISAFEARKTVVDNELNNRFTKDEVNTKLVDYVAKNEIGNYTNSRQNIVSVKYGEDLSSGDMIKIVPEFNTLTNTHEPKAYKFNDVLSDDKISWMPDQQPYTYQAGFWTGNISNTPYKDLYFSGLSDQLYDSDNKLYYILRINDHRFAEFEHLDNSTPDSTRLEIFIDIYKLDMVDGIATFTPKTHMQIGSVDRASGITFGDPSYGNYTEYIKNLKLVKIGDNGRFVCFFDTLTTALLLGIPQNILRANHVYLEYDIVNNTIAVLDTSFVDMNLSTSEFKKINNGVNYLYNEEMSCILSCRGKTNVANSGTDKADYESSTFIYTYTLSGNTIINHVASGVTLNNNILTYGTVMSGGLCLYTGVMNDISLYDTSTTDPSMQNFNVPLSDRYPSLKIYKYNNCICVIKVNNLGNITLATKVYGDINNNISELNLSRINETDFIMCYISNGDNIRVLRCSLDVNNNVNVVLTPSIIPFPHRFTKTNYPPHKNLMRSYTFTSTPWNSTLINVGTPIKFSPYMRLAAVWFIISDDYIDVYPSRQCVNYYNSATSRKDLFQYHKRLFKLVKNTGVVDATHYHFDIDVSSITPGVLDPTSPLVDVVKFPISTFDANSTFHVSSQAYYCYTDALDPIAIRTLPLNWHNFRNLDSTSGNAATKLYDMGFVNKHLDEHNINGTGKKILSVQYENQHAVEIIQYEIVYDNTSIDIRELVSFDNIDEQLASDDTTNDVNNNKEMLFTDSNTYQDAGFFPLMDDEHIIDYPYIIPKKMIMDKIDGHDVMIFNARVLDFFNGRVDELKFRKTCSTTVSSPEIYTGYACGCVAVQSISYNDSCIGTTIDSNIAGQNGNVSLFDSIIQSNSVVNIPGDNYSISLNGHMKRDNIYNTDDSIYKHVGGIMFMRSHHRYKKIKAHIRRSHLRNLLA